MIQFDESLIQKEAATLYKKARDIIAIYILVGFLFSALIGFVFTDGNINVSLMAGVVGIVIGYASALSASHRLKFNAQMLLCQLQIERNTRK